jgi:hypothetical protein
MHVVFRATLKFSNMENRYEIGTIVCLQPTDRLYRSI